MVPLNVQKNVSISNKHVMANVQVENYVKMGVVMNQINWLVKMKLYQKMMSKQTKERTTGYLFCRTLSFVWE